MYDYLYDQQDIYDYYDDIFEQKEQNFNLPVTVRKDHLPFAGLLENFDNLILEFIDDKDIETLKNYRWYNFKPVFASTENCFEQK
jgi:hypothetical protein